MQLISLLIFDLDGTLVDSLEDITASVNHTLACLGKKPITRDAVRQYVGDGVETLLVRSLGGSSDRLPEAVAVFKEHHRRNLVVRSSVYPDVRETLDHFRPLPLAVASHQTMESVGQLIAREVPSQYFSRGNRPRQHEFWSER